MHKIELTEWEREGLELHRLPVGKPSQLSDTFRAGVQFATRKSNETVIDLAKRNCALQAKIDALMLEFCPDGMAQEQIERLVENQVVSTYSKYISLKSEMCCPTSGNAKKVTVEDAVERLAKRAKEKDETRTK